MMASVELATLPKLTSAPVRGAQSDEVAGGSTRKLEVATPFHRHVMQEGDSEQNGWDEAIDHGKAKPKDA